MLCRCYADHCWTAREQTALEGDKTVLEEEKAGLELQKAVLEVERDELERESKQLSERVDISDGKVQELNATMLKRSQVNGYAFLHAV